MNFIVQVILPYLLMYKYWAIFVITFFAALAFPIPPGTLLMASAAFAAQGYFNFTWVVVVGSIGNILGDNLGYLLARKYGKSFLRYIGFGKFIDSPRYETLDKKLAKNSGFIILISRFEVFSNLSVNLMCGLGEVRYFKYLLFDVIGEVAQVLLYCSIGYAFGSSWQAISSVISNFLLLIILLAALLVIIFWKKIFNRKTK